MLARTVHTEIEVAASVAQVWAVLTAFELWSEWNPTLPRLKLRGPLAVGARGLLTIAFGPPLGTRPVGIEMLVVSDERELTWRGGLAGLMQGTHGFQLHPCEVGTRVIHAETFRGLLAPPLLGLIGGRLRERYERLNDCLRRRCESAGATTHR